MSEDNTIFIGNKPFMNYVTSVVVQFTTKNEQEVIIKARGKFIWRAVDVSQVVLNRFLKDQIIIKSVELGSEDFKNKDDKEVRVSTIEITLAKK